MTSAETADPEELDSADTLGADGADEVDAWPAYIESWNRIAAWVLVVCGAVGIVASFVLTVEKFKLAEDPDYVPSCSINPVLSCGSVMARWQAGVFGFPNPLLGVAGFAVAITVGMLLFARARPAAWFWGGLQIGVTLAVIFIHWLIVQSLYDIGALCPYCMVVWAVTIPTFLFVTIRNVHASGLTSRSLIARGFAHNHALILTAWYLVIIVLIGFRFWSYWQTLI